MISIYWSIQISYPKDILYLIMQLNRSACLGYPEACIPWFQQSFIDSQLSASKLFCRCFHVSCWLNFPFIFFGLFVFWKFAAPNKQNPFYKDIFQTLSVHLKDEHLIRQNHVTPYGYRVRLSSIYAFWLINTIVFLQIFLFGNRFHL